MEPEGTISFRQLALFVAVGRHGSVSRAAVACGLSQPAATQALALLQRRSGFALLQRGPTGTTTTPLGRLFHDRAERIGTVAQDAVKSLDVPDPEAVVPRLTPARLRVLATIAEAGSLERAAAASGVTLAAMRRSARRLEGQGVPFVRTPDGTRLAPAGERFARRIGAACSDVELGIRELHATLAETANALVVGAAQAFGNRLLARVLADLAARHPDARITVLRESPAELVGRLRAGGVDLIVGDVVGVDTGADLSAEQLVATPYFVFARPGHPLSRPETVVIEDLARYDWVGGTSGSMREAVWRAVFANETPPRIAFAASEGAMVGHFVAGSDRLALMTEHESRCGGLALAKLPFAPIESGLGIDVVRRADHTPSALHEALIALLKAHLTPAVSVPHRRNRAWRAA